jgi:16S rRNA (uracil1498-N3)-methyltransferase
MAERFYINSTLAVGGEVRLRGPEAHHLSAVCRARPGDALCLFNGDGLEYRARVVDVSRKDVTIEILAQEGPLRERPFPLHIAAPLPKGDRATFLIEKLTELGVTTFTILSTERSIVQPRDTKIEKLVRHVIEASKQCGRNVLMQIEGPTPWTKFVLEPTLPTLRLVAHPGSGSLPTIQSEVVAAVGPEGGFTDAELALAQGWQQVSLGASLLRIETAALALAARLGS